MLIVISLLAILALVLPIYIMWRLLKKLAPAPNEQPLERNAATFAAPFFLLATMLCSIALIGTGIYVVSEMVHDRVHFTGVATPNAVKAINESDVMVSEDDGVVTDENGDVVKEKQGSSAQAQSHIDFEGLEMTYVVKDQSAVVKALWAAGTLLPVVAVLSLLLCYVPMFRALHAGYNPLTVERTRLTSLGGWALLIGLPVGSLCMIFAQRAVSPQVMSLEQPGLLQLDSFIPGIVALSVATLLRRGAQAVELEEATV